MRTNILSSVRWLAHFAIPCGLCCVQQVVQTTGRRTRWRMCEGDALRWAHSQLTEHAITHVPTNNVSVPSATEYMMFRLLCAGGA